MSLGRTPHGRWAGGGESSVQGVSTESLPGPGVTHASPNGVD